MRSRLGFTMTAGPPLATYVLIGLNVVAYVLGPVLYGSAGAWRNAWAVYPGSGWEDWILSGFAHGSLWHIGFNMLALFQLGSVLEPALGRYRFLALYGLSLLGGSLSVVILGSAAIGASGAIFGLIAAYGIVLKRLNLPYTQVVVIAAIFIGGPFIGLLPGVSWQGHLGGAIVGALTMLAMFRGVDRREAAARGARS
ncbi:rhomboid family intramembrane serine protease [Demequina sp. NBRC 110055]|uniref:rhomboid family intramembrane serine protease n=1 Tax=Demequina sp. NBRC 110055 TaxID=1570344 RepID=UPI001F341EFA|nr:rhomboid family intramembrane serine protease [Demequina sp. NBRC 110055]